MTDKIIDRDKLQDALIESIIDGMDHKTMYAYVYDSLNGNFDNYTGRQVSTNMAILVEMEQLLEHILLLVVVAGTNYYRPTPTLIREPLISSSCSTLLQKSLGLMQQETIVQHFRFL